MKLNTTKAVLATVLATAFAGLSATAIAQNTTGPADMRAQHMAQRAANMTPAQQAEMQKLMQARMTDRHATRMEQLKADLKITPQQEAAWKAFVVRTEPTPPQTPPVDLSKLSTPERLDRMQSLHAERSAEMVKRVDATKSFYAQLTPEQQKTFDARGTDMHRTGTKGGHRMDGQGRHGGDRHHGMRGGMGCEGPMNGPMGGPGPRS